MNFYSGILYHGGQKPLVLKTFTQGDYITAIFDTESRTLSFAKNNDYPVVAFQNIDTKTKLYPCVLCYSTAAGQKVKYSIKYLRTLIIYYFVVSD